MRPAKKVVEVKQVRNPYVRSRSYARPSAKLVAPIRYHPAERLERMRKPQAPVRQTRDQVLDIRPTRIAPAPYRHPYNNRYLRAASHHVSRPIRGLTLEGGSHGYRTEKKEAIVLADHKPIIVSEKGCTSGSCSLKNGGSHCTCKDGHDCGCEKKKLAAKEEKDAPCDKCAIKADIYNVKPVKLGCKSGECSLSLEDDDDEKKECDKKDPENCDCGCDASLAAKAAAVAEASAEVAKEVEKELVKKSMKKRTCPTCYGVGCPDCKFNGYVTVSDAPVVRTSVKSAKDIYDPDVCQFCGGLGCDECGWVRA